LANLPWRLPKAPDNDFVTAFVGTFVEWAVPRQSLR